MVEKGTFQIFVNNVLTHYKETKFENFRKKQHFLLHMQDLNQGNHHYKEKQNSDVRFFLD